MNHEKVMRVVFFMKGMIDWHSRGGYRSSGTMVIEYRDKVPRDVVLSESELEAACASCPVGKENIPGLICGGMKYVNPMRNQMVAQLTLSEDARLPNDAMFCGLDNEQIQQMKEAPTMAEAVAKYTGGISRVPFN